MKPTDRGAMPRRGWGQWAFIALMLLLTLIFGALGTWQLQRLAEKEALTATVAERMDDAPVPLPATADWGEIDPGEFSYRPVSVGGKLRPDQTVLVFTSLANARGQQSGPGYWVMTPLELPAGGSVFINRGFVPQPLAADFGGEAADPTDVTLTGVARLSEETSEFTPASDTADRVDWVRNIDRLAAMVDPTLAPFAPVYIDLPAGAPGELPQGGETVVSFSNNHLGYAITWYGFALMTPILLVFWVLRQRRARPAGSNLR